jgi:hypothetical protein
LKQKTGREERNFNSTKLETATEGLALVTHAYNPSCQEAEEKRRSMSQDSLGKN